MTPDRWRQISAIYTAAAGQSAADRDAYLSYVCANDADLRRTVESLLAQGESFLATSAALAAGSRIGPYELVSVLGAGGMGVVYRARDTRLQRDVALKVLPEAFASDLDRIARFTREAQVLASLNHPHIAAIYGVEESGGTQALVLELVEGPTLADRIASGPIPLDEALPIARQIAEALEAAHEQGIVHRDLKPANIKVRPDGTVKVLDFGLAKLIESGSGTGDPGSERAARSPSLSPTVTSPVLATGVGVLLGTAAYMSPEQAKAKPADKRSDIWAFGCVLYEMLTGRRAFEGDDVSETLASVLARDPDWNRLPRATSFGLRTALRRCLARDRLRRLQHIGDVRLELEEPMADVPLSNHVTRRSPLAPLLWAAAGAVIGVVVAALLRSPASPSLAPEIRLEMPMPPTPDAASMAISPDGSQVVFVAGAAGASRLWLRPLGAASAEPLSGTDGATRPFWSPDSRSLAFFSDGRLKRLDLNGVVVQTLGNVRVGLGGAWSRDHQILFTRDVTGSIYRMPDTGGAAVAVTQVNRPSEEGHSFPQALPDGRHFVFYVTGIADVRGVYVGATDGSSAARLFDADSAAIYSPTGYLLFIREGTLLGQRFDADRGVVIGTPFPVADEIAVDAEGVPALSISNSGTLVYRSGPAVRERQFTWVDRAGRTLRTIGVPDSAGVRYASLSPDGRHVAMSRTVNGTTNIWLLDAERGVTTRFTSGSARDVGPVWSADGRDIVFASRKEGTLDLYRRSTSGGTDQRIGPPALGGMATDWSRDGRHILYRKQQESKYDLWALPLEGAGVPFPVLQSPFNEQDGQFSPDSEWIAYQSDESGQFEVYVQPFPGPGRKERISVNGGAQVRWRLDGKEVFYIALDGQLMSVPIVVSGDGQLRAGSPVGLFATRIGGAVQGENWQQYMVFPDGQKFLMSTVTESAVGMPITVVVNWHATQ